MQDGYGESLQHGGLGFLVLSAKENRLWGEMEKMNLIGMQTGRVRAGTFGFGTV